VSNGKNNTGSEIGRIKPEEIMAYSTTNLYINSDKNMKTLRKLSPSQLMTFRFISFMSMGETTSLNCGYDRAY
jgi:hypothetical protein